MGLFNRKKTEKTSTEAAVGSGLASVLPDHGKPWYLVPHLLKLNLLLLIPLASSGAIGYDGEFCPESDQFSQHER